MLDFFQGPKMFLDSLKRKLNCSFITEFVFAVKLIQFTLTIKSWELPVALDRISVKATVDPVWPEKSDKKCKKHTLTRGKSIFGPKVVLDPP